MRPFVRARAVLAAIALHVTVVGMTSPVVAHPQDSAANAADTAGAKSKIQGVKEFLHLINVAKPDVAAAQAQALLDAGLTASDLATIVDENGLAERFDQAMARGRGMDGVSNLAQQFDQMLRDGRLELARQPARIADALAKLTGTVREKMFARERLEAAGEYAMPALLEAVTSGKDPSREVAATEVIVSLKRLAVNPLTAALMKVDPVNQRKIADMLGEIGYPAAAPFLLELANDPAATSDVRDAAMRAFNRIGAQSTDTSAQFAELSRRYFLGDEALVPYANEPVNNVWSYNTFGGLTPTAVPTPIFREVMAMLAARKALQFDAANANALALYIASDLRRENRLPAGATDPIFGGLPYSPSFFAMAAGPSIDQSVIGLAIDRKDTELVRDGIAALGQTAGSKSLVEANGRPALLECLRYPERRVQYEAALAIGEALPQQTFPGDFSIVPILGAAVRDAGTTTAAVIAVSEEDRRQISGRLSTLGFATMNGAETFAQFEPELNASSGLDVLVVAGSADSVKSAIESARLGAMTLAVPIVAVVSTAEASRATNEFTLDPGVVVWPASGNDETFKGAVELAFRNQSGGAISEDEASDYTLRALDTLSKIAVSNSPIFSIRDAEKPLLEAIDRRQGGVRLMVADVLAMVPTETAQRKLIDAAIAASDEAEKIELLSRAAASARRFGNLANERQILAVRELIASSSGQLADAAGRLHGALNMSAAETVKLITKGAGDTKTADSK